ncbi:acyl-CoA N-acyltransferase [Aspergillus piperis CBS 112811]|uniref:Acyl-CoA N-acyltransferase n=1 Tax=Aspergillus piperis CBS 112811 TaxID=1448313 RepID=A0A8G1RBG5_9EURO|nr:acyl-CoA N-acyltransferase [Aspergillus piperis CBS 112811]RAH60220.1 acyl-CoA N-acyltransferase [Aspergillus piperis CBS 112811]
MSTRIRQATPDDQPIIEAIIQEAFSIYIARIGRKPQPMLDDYTALIKDGVVYVIERDGEIKGTVMLVPQESSLIVDNLAVAQSARGTGLGRKLLEFADESARLAGYRALQLHTNETMVENIAIYTRMGYAETHRADNKGWKRVYMAKNLD